MHLRTLLSLGLVVLLGCSRATPEGEGELHIAVQSLELGAVRDADYRLRVRNAAGATVWERDHITASRYGDGGGAISYVGTCDASSNDNVVELWVNELYSAPGVPLTTGWRNPTANGPISQVVRCVENADVAVTFDITIMRDAEQGFFDIGVEFSDIFCSAKLDCVDALLHGPDGERGPTVNVTFACTSGAAAPTWLHYSDVAVVCGDRWLWLDPHVGPGQVGAQGPGVHQLATYRGQESLAPYDKCFWNMSLGLTLGADTQDCRFVGYATASDASFGDGRRTPTGAVYPYVRFDVPLTGADGQFLASCGRHPLDGVGSQVTTDYTTPAGADFAWEWECDAATTISERRLLCDGTSGPVAASFVSTPGGVVLSVGERRSAPVALPQGLVLSDCCGNPCPGCD